MQGSNVVLGVSADYHDAAAALLVDGELVAAAAEERFTRQKHDPSLPANAIAWCLEDAGVAPGELAAAVFYAKPLTTYERILVEHARVGPRGIAQLSKAVGTWSRRKLWVAYRLERLLGDLGHRNVRTAFSEHHLSHAASAFYPSPFERAATLTLDGVGEWTTASIGVGAGEHLELVDELRYPDSLGLVYSTLTAHCGFAVNDGEYKLMGLAPYGEPRYVDALRSHVVHVGEDGSVRLDQRYFSYRYGTRMASPRLDALLDGPPRGADDPLGQREADIARSAQVVLEDAVLRAAAAAHERTGERALCLAGGVALNCVANHRLVEEGPFDEVWVQPASGDDGGAIGAALWWWHQVQGNPRPAPQGDAMRGCQLGPAYDDDEIVTWLDGAGVPHERLDDEALLATVAEALADGAVVGWFQGRMEFGPRALGNRSILADPRDPAMVGRINARVKRREGFRPFAPAVLAEEADRWFQASGPTAYMLVTAPVHPDRLALVEGPEPKGFAERLARPRSAIPACTHVDGSARVQVVDADRSPRFHALLRAFAARTGCPVLLNTSFNGPSEPIVRTPADALRCFADTGLDVLVLGQVVVRRDALQDEAA